MPDYARRCCRVVVISVLALLCCTTSFTQCRLRASHTKKTIRYSFDPIIADNELKFRITLDFTGGPQGELRLKLPSEWPGLEMLHAEQSITELKALSPETAIADTDSSTEKEIRFRPNSHVRLSYVLVKSWNSPLNSHTRFLADLSPAYFHIIGITSLAYPAMSDSSVADFIFDWQKLPADWSLATSFGTSERCQRFRGKWEEVSNALFVGGDYRIHHLRVAGNVVELAIRGKWSFSDDEWTTDVQKILAFERSFWKDNDFPYFLVTLTPLEVQGSNSGSGLTNAFMMHLSPAEKLMPTTLGTLAHEAFHAWTPNKLGYTEGTGYEVSWFYEGFTRYYQDVMLFRAGVATFPEYLERINSKIKEYELSDGTDVSLREFVQRHTAEFSDLNQLDYRRGAVLALWLDATIREKTHGHHSLDDVMLDLVRENAVYQHQHGSQEMTLTNERIFQAVSRYITPEAVAAFRRYVEQGGSIRVPENAIGPCAHSWVEIIPTFDFGFDPVSIKNKIVSGVRQDSEAYKSGLRDGQELLSWSFYEGNVSKPIRLTVKDSEKMRVLEYYPLGRSTIRQFRLDTERHTANPEACNVLQPGPAPRK